MLFPTGWGAWREQPGAALETPGGILVVTESLHSMDADVPYLRAHQELAHRHGTDLLREINAGKAPQSQLV